MSRLQGQAMDLVTEEYPGLFILNRESENSTIEFATHRTTLLPQKNFWQLRKLPYCENCVKQYTFHVKVTDCKMKTII